MNTLHFDNKDQADEDGHTWHCWRVHSKNKDWASYTSCYFVANDVDDNETKGAILLSVCGAATYKIICNLVHLHKPTDKIFNKILRLVKDLHEPPPSEIVQRLNINTWVGETDTRFIVELKRQAHTRGWGGGGVVGLDKLLFFDHIT